jgi:hypothetical protein
MDKDAVRVVRSMLPRRPMGQAEVELSVERFEPPALIKRVLVGSTRVRDSAMGALTEAEQRA